jgi:hypothetical protein
VAGHAGFGSHGLLRGLLLLVAVIAVDAGLRVVFGEFVGRLLGQDRETGEEQTQQGGGTAG